MSRVWYGNITNRLEENRQLVDEIRVGDGVTEYFYSDRHPYEVVAVKNQKNISIRPLDHKPAKDDEHMTNNWILISNEDRPVSDITKRGNYWYRVATLTYDEYIEIKEGDNINRKIWMSQFNFEKMEADHKTQKKYHRMNISIGIADYYYDYEF